MKPNQGREAAYVTSRVKDLSLITNTPDYVGCFACITPKAHASLNEAENVTYLDNQGNVTAENEENKVFLPQLVRDVDTLDMLFGDPRVDPKTYKDLYTIRYIVQNGFACYIAKVKSGNPFACVVNTESLFSNETVCPTNAQLDDSSLSLFKDVIDSLNIFNVQSSVVGNNVLKVRLVPFKPYSLSQIALEVVFETQASASSEVIQVASARVMLTPDTKNADLITSLNSYLGGDVVFSLPDYLNDRLYATVTDANDLIEFDPDKPNERYICIANALLYICGIYNFKDEYLEDLTEGAFPELLLDNMAIKTVVKDGNTYYGLDAVNEENNPNIGDKNWPRSYSDKNNPQTFTCNVSVTQESVLKVSPADYTRSLRTFRDIKYAGTFISELSSDRSYSVEKNHTLYTPDEVSGNLVNGVPYYTNANEGTANPTPASYVEFTYDGSNVPTYTEEVDHTIYSKSMEDHTVYVRSGSDSDYVYTKFTGELADNTDYYYDNNEGMTGADPDWQSFTYHESSPNIPQYAVYTKVSELTSGETYRYDANEGNDSASTVNWTSFVYDGSTIPHYTVTHQKTVYSSESYSPVVGKQPTEITANAFFYNKNEGSTNPETEFDLITDTTIPTYTAYELGEMTSEERRGLHYIVKDLAAQRKDLVCIFTTPYRPYDDGYKQPPIMFDLDRACNWVAARGEYSDLFEYGTSNTTVYAEQAFYCEMYWSWLKWRVVKLVNGLATGSSTVIVPASAFVIINALASYRSRGSYYPVAGDQGGVLPDSLTILQNPSTKAQRDKLISYRINPIFDTGVRGIQIYGNDTLNPQYTDLSAAHIARTLVSIRSRVDAYSETIKFSLNNQLTWGSWITYVSQYILEPIKAAGGLQWYQVDMGLNTTTRAEISERKIRGMVSLQFTQALEIIDLEFVVVASSLDMEA